MSTDSRLPRAIREALADDAAVEGADVETPGNVDKSASAREANDLLDRMAALIEASAPSPSLEARLLSETRVAPLRYAPFFSRLAALFDLEESAVEQQLAALANPGSWKRTGLKGVERVMVSAGPELASARTSFVRFAPGAHFPKHAHVGFEQVFVLEGCYTDDAGVRHGPGNLHEMVADTEHEFWVAESEPCIAASVLHQGLRFREWPLKLFNPFLKGRA
ncbi:MAG TPA: cupin domain-containing protein [Polyangiaceae bacterium]